MDDTLAEFDFYEPEPVSTARAERIAAARSQASTYKARVDEPMWFLDPPTTSYTQDSVRNDLYVLQRFYFERKYSDVVEKGLALLRTKVPKEKESGKGKEKEKGGGLTPGDEVEVLDLVLRAAMKLRPVMVSEELLEMARNYRELKRIGLTITVASYFSLVSTLPSSPDLISFRELLSAILTAAADRPAQPSLETLLSTTLKDSYPKLSAAVAGDSTEDTEVLRSELEKCSRDAELDEVQRKALEKALKLGGEVVEEEDVGRDSSAELDRLGSLRLDVTMTPDVDLTGDDSAPPVPPPPPRGPAPSYAAATTPSSSSAPAVPPKPVRQPQASAVEHTNFYGAPTSPTASLNPLDNPPPPSKPKKRVDAVKTRDYVELSDDDSARSVPATASNPPVPPPRGKQATSFVRPGEGAVAAQSSTRHVTSSTRSTVVNDDRPAATVGWDDDWDMEGSLAANSASMQSRWSPELQIEDVDDGREGRSRRRPGEKDTSGVGWVVTKALALEAEDGGMGGLWHTATLDVAVLDTPTTGKYIAMGSWVSTDSKDPTKSEPLSEAASPKGKEPVVRAQAPPVADLISLNDPPDQTSMDEDAPPPPPVPKESSPSSPPPSTSTAVPSSPSPPTPPKRGFFTITRAELDSIKPHPDAYYSRKTHSWAIFTALPVDETVVPPFPDSSRVETWRPDSPHPFTMPPPFEPAAPNVLSGDYYSSISAVPTHIHSLFGTLGRRVAYSDLDYYPTVIPVNLFKTFLAETTENPLVGETKEKAAYQLVLVIFRVIDNFLFRGETRSVPVTGKTFGKRIKWDTKARDLFMGILGFGYSDEADAPCLSPPSIDPARLGEGEAKIRRARLLRCWLELGIWLEDYLALHPGAGPSATPTRVKLSSSRDSLTLAMGGDSLERKPSIDDGWVTKSNSGMVTGAEEYHRLGVTPNLADKVLIAVYHEQVRCDPRNTPEYLGCLQTISRVRSSHELSEAVVFEKSKDLYTSEDLAEAYTGIGAPQGATLSEDHLSEVFASRYSEVDPSRRPALRLAMKLIARDRDSELLKAALASVEEAAKPKMELPRAYRILEVEPTTEDEMVTMIYDIRIQDSPTQVEQMREALSVIAEARDSEALRRYLQTGSLAPVETVSTYDRPVGLTNIANTCYLNSLLQYFFTVRELREAILHFGTGEAAEGDEFERVGGRLVTQAEVDRSRRFVHLLQGLFSQLIHTPAPSVTPETELAYLALVPSKEEPAPATAAPAPSADSDVVLVEKDDAIPDVPMNASSPSVLGKRGSDHLDGEAIDEEPMLVDLRPPLSPKDGNREDGSPTLTAIDDIEVLKPAPAPITVEGENIPPDAELSTREGADGVVEILPPSRKGSVSGGPPPLPPRPSKAQDLEKEVSNYMSFGRQNDVTECMDNVMFQIEAALNPAKGGESQTFYGKTRQQLLIDDPTEKEPRRIKEEPFFSLLVDVAEEGRDVYDGLDTVFDDSLVDIEGKQAERRITLLEVPPLLQIQLQRVQYDRVQQKIFKSNAHMSFPEIISMDRYLEIDPSDTDGIARRDRTNACRKEMERARARLQELKQSKDSNIGEVLRETYAHVANKVEQLGEDAILPELAMTLMEADDLEAERLELAARIKALRDEITELWAAHESANFELVSVFIHRGTALSGHYYIYIRDSSNPAKWLKFNDSQVTDINPQEIFRETTGDTNPYFLVYCRKDRLDAISSVCRDAS